MTTLQFFLREGVGMNFFMLGRLIFVCNLQGD